MPTAQPAPDRMTALARIDCLAATIHDLSALAQDGYGVARITAKVVELAFPNCPAELVHLAIRYADRVRASAYLQADYGAMQGRGELTRRVREAAEFAERETVTACEAFESAMQAHYAPNP